MALGARQLGKDVLTYVLLGDGECQEGQVWEAAMTSAHYGLGNLTAVVDRNELQAMGPIEDRMGVEPLADKWRGFGWEVEETDGHEMAALCAALDRAGQAEGRPCVIIARTVKGKGVSFMEGRFNFHNAILTPEQFGSAEAELESKLAALEARARARRAEMSWAPFVETYKAAYAFAGR